MCIVSSSGCAPFVETAICLRLPVSLNHCPIVFSLMLGGMGSGSRGGGWSGGGSSGGFGGFGGGSFGGGGASGSW